MASGGLNAWVVETSPTSLKGVGGVQPCCEERLLRLLLPGLTRMWLDSLSATISFYIVNLLSHQSLIFHSLVSLPASEKGLPGSNHTVAMTVLACCGGRDPCQPQKACSGG